MSLNNILRDTSPMNPSNTANVSQNLMRSPPRYRNVIPMGMSPERPDRFRFGPRSVSVEPPDYADESSLLEAVDLDRMSIEEKEELLNFYEKQLINIGSILIKKVQYSTLTVESALDLFLNRRDIEPIEYIIKTRPYSEYSDYVDSDGFTYFQAMAIDSKDFGLMEYLINEGADVNYLTPYGSNVLVYIAQNDDIDIDMVKFLIDKGIDVTNIDNKGNNFLHLVTISIMDVIKFELLLKLLIENGLDINSINNKDETVLLIASKRCNMPRLEVIKLLLDNGADINYPPNKSPALNSITGDCDPEDNLQVLKLMIDRSANVNFKNEYGQGILTIASVYTEGSSSSLDIVNLLIDSGADVNEVDDDGWTPLLSVADNLASSSNMETAKLLIKRGANIYTVTNDNRAILDLTPDEYKDDIIDLFS